MDIVQAFIFALVGAIVMSLIYIVLDNMSKRNSYEQSRRALIDDRIALEQEKQEKLKKALGGNKMQ